MPIPDTSADREIGPGGRGRRRRTRSPGVIDRGANWLRGAGRRAAARQAARR